MTIAPDDAPFISRVVATVRRMPGSHVAAFAQAVRGLPGYAEATAASGLPGPASVVFRENARELLEAWRIAAYLSGEAFAAIVLAAHQMREAEQRAEEVEAVATGPSSPHVTLRHTRAVVLDLIARAAREVLVVSFAAYKVDEVTQALRQAAGRGVLVRLILESAPDSGGALSFSAEQAFQALRGRVRFYVWPADRRPPGVSATLHAKAVIVDDQAAFITSANLTESALDHNLELGVLVRGGPVPARLADHFRSLMASGVLREA